MIRLHAETQANHKRADLVFCATGKSGLGHLRRIANIVTALKVIQPNLSVHLISNAGADGLSAEEANSFSATHISDRINMSEKASRLGNVPVIVDTAVLPGIELLDGPLCLILRETVQDRISDFKLTGGRRWDLVCVPNPADHWLPSVDALRAKRIAATGWIFRTLPQSAKHRPRLLNQLPTVLVASGGGGNNETAAWFKREMDTVIVQARTLSPMRIHVAQAVGPRLGSDSLLTQADEHVHVGSQLNETFAQYDAVISTVGYNSVLELAQLDVPVLLVPILRSLDDQMARARGWAATMGFAHEEASISASAQWLAATLQHGKRRTPCNLDSAGAATCAHQIMGLLK